MHICKSRLQDLTTTVYLLSLRYTIIRERRGHRKLRLCSTKYYEKKKYCTKILIVSIPGERVSILRISIPLNVLSLCLSFPISSYTGCHISSLEVLYLLSLGWNHCMHGDSLSLYQLTSTEIGPVISTVWILLTFQVRIHKCFRNHTNDKR